MSNYEELKRFHCLGDTGKRCVIIEQIRVSTKLTHYAGPRIDYITEDGEIATRLDEENFLIPLRDDVVHVT